MRNDYTLIGNPEGKRELPIGWGRWEKRIETIFKRSMRTLSAFTWHKVA
jgi:hypothetical protein